MAYALAYFLTWTCRGSWLAGDPRGSVDSEHNEFGAPCLDPDPGRMRHEQYKIKSPPVKLDPAMRAVVDQAIRDHCEFRSWTLAALNVRTQHVHCVVGRAELRPELVLGQLKSWSTRRLREANLHGPGPVWTREGSTRYLFTEHALHAAVAYVLEGQGVDLV